MEMLEKTGEASNLQLEKTSRKFFQIVLMQKTGRPLQSLQQKTDGKF
jgi:hypothetical protein